MRIRDWSSYVCSSELMLHAVVGQDQVQRLSLQQRPDRPAAIWIDHQWHTAALDNQQRLVTGDVGALPGLDSPRQMGWFGAITPAHHTDPQATALAMLDHPQDQWRLASAANSDVAHHHQRHGRLVNLTLARQKTLAPANQHTPVPTPKWTQQRKETGRAQD